MIAIGVASGLALSNPIELPGSWPLALGCLTCVAVLTIDRAGPGPVATIFLALAALLFGLVAGTARSEAIESGALTGVDGIEVRSTGFVTGPPRKSNDGHRLILQTDQGRVAVEVRRLPPGTSTGDRVSVTGSLEDPPEWSAGHLRTQGVVKVLQADSVKRLPGERGGLVGWLDAIRSRAEKALGFGVAESEAALARGFVLGQDQAITEEVADDFRASGLAHLLAVSGQNILLLSILAAALLAALGLPLRTRFVVLIALIALYVPVTGAGPSIQRAGIMGVAAIAATAFGRPVMRSWILALAAALTLGLNPRAIFDPGWQLSFAAVAGIMILARPISRSVSEVLPGSGSRIGSALADGLAVTAAASIATLPLIAFHFESVPATTLGANLVAMPAVAPSMWLGMSAAALGQIHEAFALPLNLVNSVLLAFIARVAEVAGGDGATVEMPESGALWVIVGAGVSIGGLWILVRFPRLLFAVLAAAVLIPGMMLLQGGRRSLEAPPPGGVRVEMLDIGQGDAILIRSSSGRSILVDTGPPDGGIEEAVASAGIDSLDGVLLTHLDLDHIGGLGTVLARFSVGSVFYEEMDHSIESAIDQEGAVGRRLAAGDRIDLDPGLLSVISPPAGSPVSIDRNDRSLVVLFEALGHSVLLTADAESESVPIRTGPIDVLKLAHHGSRDEGLGGLLDSTRPRLALISVGEGNRYGHPDASTTETLATAGVRTFRTDRDGTVSLVISARGLVVETGR